MKDEWGPWIEHDGKPCPCLGEWVRCEMETNPGKFVVLEARAGSMGAWSWDWKWWGKFPPGERERTARVLRYRIRKPRGLVILREVAREVEDHSPAWVRRKEREVAR